MKSRVPAIAAAAAALCLAATSAAAQGRADLRYVAPIPGVVVVTGTDSVSTTMSGMPMGDMTTTGYIRSVSELRFSSEADGLMLTGTLRELSGVMNTPMGEMPMNASAAEPVQVRLGARGPDPEELMKAQVAAGMPNSPEDGLASQRALAALLMLPGRELRVGETWTDTTRLSPTIEGMQTDVTVITRGTYTGDTIVGGRTLNVLDITSEMTNRVSGSMQGMDMTQTMTAETRERVLWDSARHVALHRDGTSDIRSEIAVPAQGMTLNMKGRSRSIVVAEPQG